MLILVIRLKWKVVYLLLHTKKERKQLHGILQRGHPALFYFLFSCPPLFSYTV